MPQSLAYHLVVHALEGRSGWTPSSRFASAVTHVINGHLPYDRYNAAGRFLAGQRVTERQIEMAVMDLLGLDLTPGVRLIGSLSNQAVMIDGFNLYNESAGIAVRTKVNYEGRARIMGEHGAVVIARRRMSIDGSDPWPCRSGTLAMFQGLLNAVERNHRIGRPKALSLAALAELLGVQGSAAAEAATVFESEGSIRMPELARRLGCHQRSLERKLRMEGLTAEALRSATRLLRASDRLATNDSLTTIAIEEGFSDLAHMSRSFKISSGVQPSALRKILLADAALTVSARGASVLTDLG